MTLTTTKKNKTNKNNSLKKNLRNITLAGLLTLPCTNALAIETIFNLHKGSESKTAGFSVAVADNFSKGSNFYWSVGYSSLRDISVDWYYNVQVEWLQDIVIDEDKGDLYFNNNTIDATLSYRQKLRGYNNFLKKVTIEYQAGASLGLTDNKFFWTDLNEEKYFSEKGDINPLLAISTHYNFDKKTALVLGLKYQPSFSEFGDISSIFLGINYKFGKVINY